MASEGQLQNNNNGTGAAMIDQTNPPTEFRPRAGPALLERTRVSARVPWWAEQISTDNWWERMKVQFGGRIEEGRPPEATHLFAPSLEEVKKQFLHLQYNQLFEKEKTSLGLDNLKSPEARYQTMAFNEVGAIFLAVRFWTGDAEARHANAPTDKWSSVFLTVINVPSVNRKGAPIRGEQVWPGRADAVSFLPGKIPRPTGLCFPILGSSLIDSRSNRLKNRIFYTDHPENIWTFPGEDQLKLFRTAASTCREMRPSDDFELLWHSPAEFEGTTAPPSVVKDLVTPGHTGTCCIIPPFLLLPYTHQLPVLRLWDPAIGVDGIISDVQTLSNFSDSSLSDWFRHSLTTEFFKAVENHSEIMSFNVVYQDQIQQSLPQTVIPADGHISDGFVHLRFLIDGLAYKLHRDTLLVQLEGPLLRRFLEYEKNAKVSFGNSSYVGDCPVMQAVYTWYWRPPSYSTWATKMKLESFTQEEAVPPYIRKFKTDIVELKKGFTGLPLESVASFEANAALDEEERISSPRQDLIRERRISRLQQSRNEAQTTVLANAIQHGGAPGECINSSAGGARQSPPSPFLDHIQPDTSHELPPAAQRGHTPVNSSAERDCGHTKRGLPASYHYSHDGLYIPA
ncbi:MAG: hypothetical protein ACREBR_02585, partial [bacterium]